MEAKLNVERLSDRAVPVTIAWTNTGFGALPGRVRLGAEWHPPCTRNTGWAEPALLFRPSQAGMDQLCQCVDNRFDGG
jgi:hypothetical protein